MDEALAAVLIEVDWIGARLIDNGRGEVPSVVAIEPIPLSAPVADGRMAG